MRECRTKGCGGVISKGKFPDVQRRSRRSATLPVTRADSPIGLLPERFGLRDSQTNQWNCREVSPTLNPCHPAQCQSTLQFWFKRQKMRRALTLSLTSHAPSNSNHFIYHSGFGFQRRRGAKPASFCLTGETESGAHAHPTSQSTFRSAVRPCLSPRDRRERFGGSIKRRRHRPHSLGPDK